MLPDEAVFLIINNFENDYSGQIMVLLFNQIQTTECSYRPLLQYSAFFPPLMDYFEALCSVQVNKWNCFWVKY